MLMPSATVMVPKMMDLPPAASAPAPASRARASMCMLQGVSMLQVEATPTTVFLKSSSLKPTARNMERFGARSEPSCTMEEYFRRRSGLDMAGWGRRGRTNTTRQKRQIPKRMQSGCGPLAGARGHRTIRRARSRCAGRSLVEGWHPGLTKLGYRYWEAEMAAMLRAQGATLLD